MYLKCYSMAMVCDKNCNQHFLNYAGSEMENTRLSYKNTSTAHGQQNSLSTKNMEMQAKDSACKLWKTIYSILVTIEILYRK